jgi:hypothetical protein
MEYLVGVALALGVGVLTSVAGFDRDRSLYPVILMVTASYYDLFAVIGGGTALGCETGVTTVFVLASIIGFRTNLWIVVAALVGHSVLDLYHSQLIENAGVPAWWPMFCLSFDVAAAAYLALLLLSRKIGATNSLNFGRRIRSCVEAELAAARASELGGDPIAGFLHLERAHVLGQGSTVQHVRVHQRMLMWAIRRHDLREVVGQLLRVTGAAAGTWVGLVPQGNTGGAKVSAFKALAIPDDLSRQIWTARSPGANAYGVLSRQPHGAAHRAGDSTCGSPAA